MICFISARPVGYHLSAAEQSHDESDTTSSLLPEVITTLMPEVPVQSTALPLQKEHSSPPATTDNSLSKKLMNKILSTGRATTRKPHRCDDHCKISCSQVSTEALDYYDSCRNQDKYETRAMEYFQTGCFINGKRTGELYEKREIKSNDCEISCAIDMATMEMIGRTALGVKFNAQKNAKHVFAENLHVIQKICEYRVTHPWFLNNSLFQLSTFKRKHDISQSKIYNFIEDLAERLNTEWINNNTHNQGEHDEECIDLKSKSFIEILLENGHQMTFKQLRDEIITVIFAGQDTTAFTNACAIFMLAHHQDVQNKVLEELLAIFSAGDPDRQPTYEDLQKMQYLERVIKETLRLYTVTPLFARKVEKETMIEGYLIPEGTAVDKFV
ncbi:cytochrome P450 4C1-like [Adelges cooleyi]|uniref:cytochrome P450 4C1-like n=1 Tax=Adelges cooleyi TaxID=133065 RepID=UPI0021802878|nr:cytochrome P450 4C1-like [Adelges cooleyi]